MDEKYNMLMRCLSSKKPNGLTYYRIFYVFDRSANLSDFWGTLSRAIYKGDHMHYIRECYHILTEKSS